MADLNKLPARGRGATARGGARVAGRGRGRPNLEFKATPAGHKPRQFTDAEVLKMTEGYIVLPNTRWASLKPNQLVRYTKKDGSFISGGKVVAVRFKSANGKNIPQGLRLQSVKGVKGWDINFENMREIYVKPTGTEEAIVNTLYRASDSMGRQQEAISATRTTMAEVCQREELLKNSVKTLDGNTRKIATALSELSRRLAAVEAKVAKI
jgi:hypothetical protein